MCLVIAGCVLVTLVAGVTGSIYVFATMYLFWGGLLGATTPVLTALISRIASDRQQGHVLGLAQSTAQISAIAGIALGGWFARTAGLSNIYFLVGFVYFAGLVLCAVICAKTRSLTVPEQQSGD
jgi:MFS family permease